MNDKGHFHASTALWRKLKPLARQNRHEPTPAENALWQRVRNRQIKGLKFRRQYSIERFIVDFVCLEQKLIIEVDGNIHDEQPDYDEIRELYLQAQGFCILRFRNEMVLNNIEMVIQTIHDTIN